MTLFQTNDGTIRPRLILVPRLHTANNQEVHDNKAVLKTDWFCIAKQHDWHKKLAPLFHPIKSLQSRLLSRVFPRFALYVFTSSFDWFTGFSLSFVIGQSDNFSFGFTTRD